MIDCANTDCNECPINADVTDVSKENMHTLGLCFTPSEEEVADIVNTPKDQV